MSTQVQIPQATPDQIVAFKQGAAQRYKELGLTPAQANQVFDAYMGKLAESAGLVQAPGVDKELCTKIAESLKARIKAPAQAPAKK